MNIIFVQTLQFHAAGLLYKLKEYGPENACVVDFPTQDPLFNGLAFIFRESNSIANLSVIVYRCCKDFSETEGYFYNDVTYYIDKEQRVDLTNLAPYYICALGDKVFDTESGLLAQKNALERMLIEQDVTDRFTSFVAPEEFFQELRDRRGADYWGNRR